MTEVGNFYKLAVSRIRLYCSISVPYKAFLRFSCPRSTF